MGRGDRKGTGTVKIPANRRCEHCGERWAQHGLMRGGQLVKLCRRCERLTAPGKTRVLTTFEREQSVLTRRLQRDPEPKRVETQLQPYRPVVIDGQQFEVVWDGRLRVEGGV